MTGNVSGSSYNASFDPRVDRKAEQNSKPQSHFTYAIGKTKTFFGVNPLWLEVVWFYKITYIHAKQW